MNQTTRPTPSMRCAADGLRTCSGAVRAFALLLAFFLIPVQALLADPSGTNAEPAAEHVILISVDGLRPDAITEHSPDDLPNFYRLREEGAFTDNARTDYDYSITLPNHMSQLTSRPVTGDLGHNWTSNDDPDPGETLHSNKGAYVASVFDVAHDNGLRTAAYVSKSKFVLLDQSYGGASGAPDVTGEDNGRDKIDAFVYEEDTEDLVERFVRDMESDPYDFAFVHLKDPDHAGHSRRWSLRSSSSYMEAVRKADRLVGRILDLVEADPRLRDNTLVVLTADHGGRHWSHGNASHEDHYTIPFYVWGNGVVGGNLYELNADVFQDPGDDRPSYQDIAQPIRNGSAGNLALSLLGLEPIPGSFINTTFALSVLPEGPLMADGATPPANALLTLGTD